MHYQLLPLLSILLLMMNAFIMPLYKKVKQVYRVNMLVATTIFIVSLISAYFVSTLGGYVFTVGKAVQPFGIALRVTTIDSGLAVVFSFIYLMISWSGLTTLEREVEKKRVGSYYALSSLLVASLLGIIFTYDIFTGFVFLEVNTLAACGIVAIRDTKDSIKATLKYMILSSLSSGLVLLAIAFVYTMTGHLSMPFVREQLQQANQTTPDIVLMSLILFTFGIAIKAALFPLHVWLLDTYSSAPTTTSALLSSIVNKAPLLFLIKLYYWVYGFEILKASNLLQVLLVMGSIAMIAGSLFARKQVQLKRMVAYSSVAQMGYIFFGIGLGNSLGLAMAIYQMVAHGLTKSTIFLTSGAFIQKTGLSQIEDLKGVGKVMPVTLGIFTLCGLSMVGIPVLPGFINKWNLAIASIEANQLVLLLVLLLSSLLNATYYFPIIINGYFGMSNMTQLSEEKTWHQLKELMPLIVLAVAIFSVGLFSGFFIEWIQKDLFLTNT